MSKALEMAKELVKMLEEQENEAATENEENEAVQLSTLEPGEVFVTGIGKFIVLEQGTTGTAVISQGFVREDIKFDDGSPDYKKSNLKELMDDEIQAEFEKEFGSENIIEHEVDLVTVDGQNDYGTCTCKVRPVTFDEYRKYGKYAINADLDDWWWTCTPWSTPERGYEYSVTVVSPRGYFDGSGCCSSYGVRPFCILKSNIFVSKEA